MSRERLRIPRGGFFGQQRKTRWFGQVLVRQVRPWTQTLSKISHSHFRSDVRAHTELLSFHVKAHRTVEPVAIEQSHRRHLQMRRLLHEVFGQCRAFEKAEG